MNRNLSVIALAARASLMKVIGVTLLAALVCGALLWFAPAQATHTTFDADGMEIIVTDDRMDAEMMVRKSRCVLPAMLGLAAVVILLARVGTGKGVSPGLTVRRLGVPVSRVTALWALYDCIMILFYRAVLILAVYGVAGFRLRAAGPQALLLASYNNAFLHNLLPLRDIGGWVLLSAMTLLIGISCARVSAPRWQEKPNAWMSFFCSLSIAMGFMNAQMGRGMLAFLISFCLILIGVLVAENRKAGEDEDDQ